MTLLRDHGIPFLIGGGYAMHYYTGIERATKDLDLFMSPAACTAALEVLRAKGYRTQLKSAHWLAKVFSGPHYVDFILGFSNGIAQVDDSWFKDAPRTRVYDILVPVVRLEETLWTKAFVQARDRFDGADIAHLIQKNYRRMNWPRLIALFGEHWRVLLAHLVMFGFIYPGDRRKVPSVVMRDLLARLDREERPAPKVCHGPLLSHTEYVADIKRWNYRDARLPPFGHLNERQLLTLP